MNTVTFLGKVYPVGFKINAAVPAVKYDSDDGTISGTMLLRIEDSNILARWVLNHKFNPDTLFPLYRHAERLIAAMADLVALKMGYAAVVVIDRWIDPTGKEDTLALAEPATANVMNFLGTDKGMSEAFNLITKEQQLLLVLRDLVSSIASQDHKAINCARCVEAVRQLVAGYHLEAKQQWPIMREKLNLEAPYLKLITDNSTDHRHGKQTEIDPAVVVEIMVRTWTIVDRFLYYRSGGDQKLDLTKFPVLTGP